MANKLVRIIKHLSTTESVVECVANEHKALDAKKRAATTVAANKLATIADSAAQEAIICGKVIKAWQLDPTEVRMQAAGHPSYNGQKYFDRLDLIRATRKIEAKKTQAARDANTARRNLLAGV